MTKPLLQYLPTSLPGYIIITGRSREVALKIVDYRDLVEIQPMDKSEGLELLLKKLGSDANEDSRKLVEELEYMPLAIVQAAGYIRSRAPRYSVTRYLADFRKSDREATNLLKQEASSLYRDWEASNSVLVTWQMSFDRIRRKRSSAADVLSLMCFFDRQGIPEYLLRVQDKSNSDSHAELINDSDDDGERSESDMAGDFEDDIATLRDYSFISIIEDGAIFTMHRLVQLTTRIWLKTHGTMAIWTERFISNLCSEFPTDEYENWEKCGFLFPHVKSAMSQRPELLSLQSRQNWATLLYRGAWYALKTGNIVDIIEMAKRSRKERVKLLGAENKDSLSSTAVLALAYEHRGQWEKAEKLQVQVMEMRRTKHGKKHRHTLISMGDLAFTFKHQGRYTEAERLEVQVLETSKKKLGQDHPDTLISMSNLASIFGYQGRYKEAERLQMEVMEMSKAKLGEDHPDTIASMSNLASIFGYQGRYKEAEGLKVQVLEASKKKLGEDHPDTLVCMSNLSWTWKHSGQTAEAIDLLQDCLARRERVIGIDHPDTLSTSETLRKWTSEELDNSS